MNDSLGVDIRLHEGRPLWSERGADSWNFFSSDMNSIIYNWITVQHP